MYTTRTAYAQEETYSLKSWFYLFVLGKEMC